MGPRGYVLIKKEFTATTLWPAKTMSLIDGWIDLEKIYKEALAGKMVPVMDISVNNDSYLVCGKSKEAGEFIWGIEKADTVEGSFLPIIFKYGIWMPAGLSAVEEFRLLAESFADTAYKQSNKK
jgi:hypothetical protein